MAKTFSKDEEIIAALKNGSPEERRHALQHFFQNPRLMKWTLDYVRAQGGGKQEGKDVFEEAFLVFERQTRLGHFRGESSLESWFHGIVRWQWLSQRRKQRPTAELEQVTLPSSQPSPENLLINEERRVILQVLLAQVGERCQRLLGFFQLDYSMREIQQLMGYANEQVAANEVHSCRSKLKKLLQQRREEMEALQNRKS